MIRLSQFAASTALGTSLFIGVQGCSHERGDEIPASATELSSGKESVNATAPRDGMVYVWDQDANRQLYTAKVDKGDTIRVDAKENKIWFNDKLVTKRDDMVNDHRYKIFFDQAELDREKARQADARFEADRTAADRQAAERAAAQAQTDRAAAQSDRAAAAADRAAAEQAARQSADQSRTTVVTPNSNVSAPSQGTTVVVPPPQSPPQPQPQQQPQQPVEPAR